MISSSKLNMFKVIILYLETNVVFFLKTLGKTREFRRTDLIYEENLSMRVRDELT
jgi:hypothetical protein